MQVEGTLKVINDEQQVSDKFRKREIVVTTDETYPQHILIEFQQDKCDLLNKANVGDKVKVSINIRGREYTNKTTGEVRYFNSVQGWKIELVSSAPVAQAAADPVPAVDETETPF